MLANKALVLEGGGMRGAYSAGVMEYFLENNLFFPYVIGVSAGAANAASYLSKQRGRNKKVSIEYVADPRYLSLRNYRKSRQLFGMDFIFDEIPNKYVPYDFPVFQESESEFMIGATDCHSGEPVYFGKMDYGAEMLKLLKASSSLPFVAPEVEHNGMVLLDGGISDPIPIKKAQNDGYQKAVVVLTRNKGYMKKPSKLNFLVKRKYPLYPGLYQAMTVRYEKYNDTLKYLEQEEKNGRVIIIRPQQPMDVGRMERNPRKLEKLYDQGFQDAKNLADRIVNF
ncbi:patatin-like phospholipase family protein [Cytobacillus purgationiresistens]|uniref:Patatin/cPLA2 family phospholipase n=1 Tax=Cytobacillus purgationiresistens TaxID=863449 RepID=A0ABU0AR07_9BACI|nr:patatin family protein [Cytobacillus purgationiresistens]MDQ0273699.1 putative patatin/cPLA2 family phospholipase [Cytobacillus purgationiresistens]